MLQNATISLLIYYIS